jgi:hypothetical protein
MAICVFAYLRIRAPTKNYQAGLKIQKTPSKKNVPEGSFVYLRIICLGGYGKRHA